MATEHVHQVRVVGIDLAGVRSATTGLAECLVERSGPPVLVSAEHLPRASTPRVGERLMRERLRHLGSGDVVVIDAPLTLPPALRGACPDLADRESAPPLVRRMWDEGWHPVTARECEFLLREAGLPRPGATMRLGMIGARGMVLAHELRAKGVVVLETYPRAVRWRLNEVHPGEGWGASSEGLASAIRRSRDLRTGPGIDLDAASADALDAALCALVGVAYLRGLTDGPPAGLDEQRDGWIRVPSLSVPAVPAEGAAP